jgi:hypothetical protein
MDFDDAIGNIYHYLMLGHPISAQNDIRIIHPQNEEGRLAHLASQLDRHTAV